MTNPTPPGQVPDALICAELPKHAATGLGEEYESFDQNGKPMGKAYQNLVYYTEDQMRAFADATHALRTAHVQNPAEIEHVAGDVSKNGAEVNTTTVQQPRGSARELELAARAVVAADDAQSLNQNLIERLRAEAFARAIDAEVRKDDEALMRQLSDALEWLHLGIGPARDPMRAITAARARLLDSDLSNLTERGAKAWAGVDVQKLREDGTT